MDKQESIKLLGVKITTSTEDKILEYVVSLLGESGNKAYITTPNPEMIMHARKSPSFNKILNEANVALPDGVGITLCAYLMGKGHIQRITGVDFMEKLCGRLSKSPYSVGFFGGQASVAETTSKRLQKKYSRLNVSYASDQWNEGKIKGGKIDILFVAMGYPKQEEWIYNNLPHIPVKIAMGVGGSFDYISGNVPRAPKTMRNFGLEWLYRLFRQPWRWRRQLALISFTILSLKEAVISRIK